jgi:hypothetical protein
MLVTSTSFLFVFIYIGIAFCLTNSLTLYRETTMFNKCYVFVPAELEKKAMLEVENTHITAQEIERQRLVAQAQQSLDDKPASNENHYDLKRCA